MDEEQRFDAMQSLAMVRYAPAVKDAEEFRKVDSDRYYWQVYFIFGLFDDLAVPMLCEKPMKIAVLILFGLPSLRCRFCCLPPYLPWLFIRQSRRVAILTVATKR